MKPEDKLSKYFKYGEVIYSETAQRLGIPNIPTEEQLEKIKLVLLNISDPIREYLGVPVFLSSGFRSAELNAATAGASKTSQHMKGEAIDHQHFGLHKKIFLFVRDHLDFDQLIYEFGDTNEPAWVHVSYVNYRKNRKQLLRYYIENNTIKGVPFDLNIN